MCPNRLQRSFSRQYGPGDIPRRKRSSEKARRSSSDSAVRTLDKMTYVVTMSVIVGVAKISPQSAKPALSVEPCIMNAALSKSETRV